MIKATQRRHLISGIAFWLCLATFLILAFGILTHASFITALDGAVYSFIISFKNPTLTNIFKILTEFGGAKIIVIASAVILLALQSSKLRWNFFAGMITILATNQILKHLIRRPRPELARRLVEENGFSFPSGHSMCSMAFYGFAIYYFYHAIREPKLKWAVIILLSALIGIIGISRIYLGVHYPSDVIAGFALTAAFIIGLTYFSHPMDSAKENDANQTSDAE